MKQLFLCSWLARFFYLEQKEENVAGYFRYYYRCNSTLAIENNLYNVDCRYDEDLSGDSSTSFTRTEDATIPCFKVVGNETGYGGVSQNSDLKIHCCKISKDSNLIEY